MGAQDDWVIQSCLFEPHDRRPPGGRCEDGRIIAWKSQVHRPRVCGHAGVYKRLYDDGVLSRRIMNTTYNEVNGLFASGKAPS